ncbi:MAG: hypothetical protein KGY54_07725 [Oleiphilaceae bacterium]|nr:hypothetical protein [Oleiphilaceae bacterium]
MPWCCETNILSKALSCDTVRHFITLTRFVRAGPAGVPRTGLEFFAIDGGKTPSDAGKEWSGKFGLCDFVTDVTGGTAVLLAVSLTGSTRGDV